MGTSDYLLKLLGKLPPRFVLDGYWSIVQLIVLGMLNPEDSNMHELEREWLSLQNLPDEAWDVIRDDNLSLLVENDLITPTNGGEYKRTEEFDRIYFLLNNCIRSRNSSRRLVAWALWRLFLTKNEDSRVEIKEIIHEISYPDKVYETLIEKPLQAGGIRNKSFLMKDPYGRIAKVLSENPSLVSPNEIIQEIRRLETAEITKLLKKLGVTENRLSDEAIERVKSVLLECYGYIWPSFGTLIVQDMYFKIFRGQSLTLYVDAPNWAAEYVVNVLKKFSVESSNEAEFYDRTIVFLKEVNNRLKDNFGFQWFRFSIQRNKFMRKPFGLKVQIRWPQLIEFVENFSESDKPIWKKYEYISSSRLPALEIVLNRKSKRIGPQGDAYIRGIQDAIKTICLMDIKDIDQELNEIVTLLNKLKENAWKFYKRRKRYPILAILAYLPEGITLVNTINEMAHNGIFPSCYRELRKFIENLSWALFGDYLALKAYQRHGIIYDNYALSISKQWYEWDGRKLINIKLAKDEIGRLYNSLKAELALPGKDKFWNVLMSEVTFPSFMALFGDEVESRELPDYIPRYFSLSQIVPYAQKDFEIVGRRIGLQNPKKFGEALIEATIGDSAFIIPPYLTNDIVIAMVEKWFNVEGLNRKYGEYSMFVHSYPQSWVVFPFSSVIEVKAFKKELLDVKSLLEGLSKEYKALLKTK